MKKVLYKGKAYDFKLERGPDGKPKFVLYGDGEVINEEPARAPRKKESFIQRILHAYSH